MHNGALMTGYNFRLVIVTHSPRSLRSFNYVEIMFWNRRCISVVLILWLIRSHISRTEQRAKIFFPVFIYSLFTVYESKLAFIFVNLRKEFRLMSSITEKNSINLFTQAPKI